MTTRVLSALVGVVVGGFGLAADPCTSSQPRILVLTQEHTIWLCDRGEAVAQFRVALGSGGIGKRSRGDKKTPIGTYSLGKPRPSARFGTFIPLGYPTTEQRSLGFTGNGVGIHGPDRRSRWAGETNTWFDWTAGCIALGSDEELEKVASWVKEKNPTVAIQ